MKTLAFLDCPTGLSGDMCLGALVDGGVPLDHLRAQLARVALTEPYVLSAETLHRNGIAATKAHVRLGNELKVQEHAPLRHLTDIEHLINAADLSQRIKDWSLGIFRRLAQAEGAVHGMDPNHVHFHEVGATDAIVDIVGTCIGLDWLGVDILYCSPLPMGSGTVRAAHGRLPVPAPAVLKLMEMAQVPIYGSDLTGELVTPTGAAIATTLVKQFGPPPAMTLKKVGLGAGSKDLALPNMLRLWLGKAPSAEIAQAVAKSDHRHSHGTHEHEPLPALETVTVLETQVDDLSPQAIGYLYDHLLGLGALDVLTQGVTMKKSRPGHLITVIAHPEQATACEQAIFQETTTLGIRRQEQQRVALHRELQTVETPLGSIRIKIAFDPKTQQVVNVHPEYEDCAVLARQHQLPWRTVHHQALCEWQKQDIAKADAF
ncbi:MAG: nickel pincer cofactor biosynthesis protein LarC [Leptolyngbyaceae cyanobacterium]